MFNDYGGFTARTTVAGAYPVEGALVRIFGASEENRDIAQAVLTDRDGLTPKIALPTPDRRTSLRPSATPPYALYDIEIRAEGYYPKNLTGVTVFPGTDSLLEVNMIPYDSATENERPKGNLNAEI